MCQSTCFSSLHDSDDANSHLTYDLWNIPNISKAWMHSCCRLGECFWDTKMYIVQDIQWLSQETFLPGLNIKRIHTSIQ